MGAPGPGTVLLFVGGDPSVAGQLVNFPHPQGGWVRFLLPTALFPARTQSAPPPPETAGGTGLPWLVPAGQLRCLELLGAAAERAGRQVRVIDVNLPSEEERALVTEWVGPADDVLPVLVRSDGARLVGQESFTPASLRRFLSVA